MANVETMIYARVEMLKVMVLWFEMGVGNSGSKLLSLLLKLQLKMFIICQRAGMR